MTRLRKQRSGHPGRLGRTNTTPPSAPQLHLPPHPRATRLPRSPGLTRAPITGPTPRPDHRATPAPRPEHRQQEIKVHSDVLKAQYKAAEDERHTVRASG